MSKPETESIDVVLVGAGIMSLTLASLIKQLEPSWSITIIEKLPKVALESSNPWNNAGTGHSALCELNYSPEAEDGTINITNAIKVNEHFQLSRQYWAWLVENGIIDDPKSFINPVPHMSFVIGEKNISYLKRRYELLKDQPLFAGMQYSEDYDQIAAWAPLIMSRRSRKERVAATFIPSGTDVNFGALSENLAKNLKNSGVRFIFEQELKSIKKTKSGWKIRTVGLGSYRYDYSAKYVFVGAGGAALPILQKSKIREIRGYGGFPVSGQFYRTTNPALVEKHLAKVYGRASVGAPPMSVPHLDTRVVGENKALLFGPYAGFSPRFLKFGSLLDLFKSVRFGNLIPLIASGLSNLSLVRYLVGELLASKDKKLAALQEYFPAAKAEDWELITAGQRVQVVKPDPKKGGVLQFGTEVIAAKDGSIAGLLGASPGASTCVPIMLEVLEKSFAKEHQSWLPKLKTMIPSLGVKLSENPELAKETLQRTATILKIHP